MIKKKTLAGMLGATALGAGLALSAAPAMAAYHTGTTYCPGTRVAVITTHSSTSGSGTAVNIATSTGFTFTFPGGHNTQHAYPSTSWTVNNGSSGFFYSTPYGACS